MKLVISKDNCAVYDIISLSLGKWKEATDRMESMPKCQLSLVQRERIQKD